MSSTLYVDGRAALLSPAAIRTYRQSGLLVARRLLAPHITAALTAACRTAAAARGPRVFPAIDDEHDGRVEFNAHMAARPTANLAAQTPPPEVQERLRRQDEAQALERHYRKVMLKCKNMREVDRVYAKLAAQREQYMKFKDVKNFATEEEERTGRISDRRIREIGDKYKYDDVKKSFEAYRDSGKMELEVRRDYHLDRALEHLQNWSKCWCRVWPESTPLQQLLLQPQQEQETECGELGRVIGEAAAALSGGIVIRLFDDAIHDAHNFLNCTPFHFVGNSTNFRSLTSLTVLIGLECEKTTGAAVPQTLVIPGSHHAMREFTQDGKDFSRFRAGGVFDMGRAIRQIEGLRELPVVQLEPLEPGSVLFINHYTLNALQPTMCGSAAPYVPPSVRAVNGPYQYAMTLMPHRCVFDGVRNSWASRDTHGPLHSCKAGDPLTNDTLFPVLHRALDVE
ncbi:hypothetical protein LSM04_006404 [Trypanosoma melophagium]|uniref:uncharacterized protein n=1 Tax=Trypanosoma melophagium TaxID=715481 RepID=UPI00351A5C59|nr:hypothetical protein LSM04_006404 [Trypanosoma melophagium]